VPTFRRIRKAVLSLVTETRGFLIQYFDYRFKPCPLGVPGNVDVSFLKCGIKISLDIPKKNAIPQQRPYRRWNSPTIHHSGIFSISSCFRFFNQHMTLGFINTNRHNPSIFIIMGFMATSLIIWELIIAPPTSTHQF
jgi:hypothetical protein